MGATWASRERGELQEAIWQHLTEAAPSRRGRARIAYALDLWIAHLVLLDEVLAIAPIPWQELRGEELEGLLALRAARGRFQREYHSCAECGAAVKGKICTRCGAVG